MVGGCTAIVESADIIPSEFYRSQLVRAQPFTRGGRARCDRNEARLRAVDPDALLDERGPSARADIGDDRRYRFAQGGIGPLSRTRQRRFAACRRQFAPDQRPHIIIFSMGSTRIAEAPAALSFCSVSQNTDSWQTAWTAK